MSNSFYPTIGFEPEKLGSKSPYQKGLVWRLFELEEKLAISHQTGDLQAYHPSWLPKPEIPRATIDKLLRAFENVIQTELLKIRWQEIQSFTLAC